MQEGAIGGGDRGEGGGDEKPDIFSNGSRVDGRGIGGAATGGMKKKGEKRKLEYGFEGMPSLPGDWTYAHIPVCPLFTYPCFSPSIPA